MLLPLPSFYSLDYLGRQLLNQPFFVYVFSLSTRISPVSHIASTTLVRSLPLFCLSFGLTGPFSFPPPFSSPLLLTVPSLPPSPFPSCVCRRDFPPFPVPVPASSPLPSLFPSCVPSFAPAAVHASSPSPSPSPSTSPFPPPPPTSSPLPPPTLILPPIGLPFPFPWTRLPPRHDVRAQTPGLTNGAAGCPQACVCVCVCVFIKLHITAQSGPVILFILCHSH